MRVTQTELDRYRRKLESARDSAAEYVRRRVEDECRGLTVADARDAAIEIVSDAVDVFGGQAQLAACDFFDEMAEACGEKVHASPIEGITDPSDIDGKVRYYARKLADGDIRGFADDCARRTGFYVWREANMCTALNCEEAPE